jgi:aryl-alcohol dehydrogenase-like predicted oxidoreductase
MQNRQMGPNGPFVSALGIGAMSFSDMYGPTTKEQSFAILDRAVDAGVTHIDTANIYGRGVSETVIGQWLANRGGENPFFIATKASITSDADGNRTFDNSPEHLEAELDQSLTRLGLDCVDLFYIHRRDPRFEIEEVSETLIGLMKKGKIKSFGYSEIAPSSLRRAQAVHPVAAVQNEYSLSTRAPDLGLVQNCAETRTAMVAFSPVGRGLLTDTPPSAERIAASVFLRDNPRFTGRAYQDNLKRMELLQSLARDMGISTAGLAIAWVLSRGDNVIAIPGTRSVEHLNEMLQGTEKTLSTSDLEAIETALPVGWASGDRYGPAQWNGPEQYC